MGYFSAEDTLAIGESLSNLWMLKLLYDHGYDVSGINYVDESAYGNDTCDDMFQILIGRIFDVDEEEGFQHLEHEEQPMFGYLVYVEMPIVMEFKRLEDSVESAKMKKRIARYLNRFAKKLSSILTLYYPTEIIVELADNGFKFDYFPASGLADLVEPLIELKRKADRYLATIERSVSRNG